MFQQTAPIFSTLPPPFLTSQMLRNLISLSMNQQQQQLMTQQQQLIQQPPVATLIPTRTPDHIKVEYDTIDEKKLIIDEADDDDDCCSDCDESTKSNRSTESSPINAVTASPPTFSPHIVTATTTTSGASAGGGPIRRRRGRPVVSNSAQSRYAQAYRRKQREKLDQLQSENTRLVDEINQLKVEYDKLMRFCLFRLTPANAGNLLPFN